MSIKSITTDFAGEVGVLPRLVRIQTTDSFATITTENYLKSAEAMGFTFYQNDCFVIAYGTDSATTQFFTVTISSGDITLVPQPGNIDLPVTALYFAIWDGSAGRLASGATTATNPGNIHAGLSGTAGNLVCYPSTAASGAFKFTATANATDTNVTVTNASHGQATTYTINDVAQSTGWLMNCTHSTDPGANLITFDVTVSAAALASGGSVTLVPSSGSKQYKVRQLLLNAPGTNFSGGGGNRLGSITDGTTVYGTLSAATMQTLVNGIWGPGADIAMPSTGAKMNTSTAAGASLVFKYTSGTTDYSTGSVTISGMVERVA